MGKSTINGPFSMAMLNNQRVYGKIKMFQTTNQLTIFQWPGVSQVFQSLLVLAAAGLRPGERQAE